MSRVSKSESRLWWDLTYGCRLNTIEGSAKDRGQSLLGALTGTGGRAGHGVSGGFLNIAEFMVGLGMGTWTSLFSPPKTPSVNSLPRHTRASSVSPLTRTNGSQSTQPLWWLPTRGSGALRPRLIYTQWRIMPTMTCSAVRVTSLTSPQLQGSLWLGLPPLPCYLPLQAGSPPWSFPLGL